MKCAVFALSLSVFLVGCASSNQPSGPAVAVQLEQLNSSNDVFYFRGPVNIQYRVAITNPTNQPLTLTRLDRPLRFIYGVPSCSEILGCRKTNFPLQDRHFRLINGRVAPIPVQDAG